MHNYCPMHVAACTMPFRYTKESVMQRRHIIWGICVLSSYAHAVNLEQIRSTIRIGERIDTYAPRHLHMTDEQASSLLHYTVNYRQRYNTRHLLDIGLSPTYANHNGDTPRDIALYDNDPDLTYDVMSWNQSYTMLMPSGDAPMHYAIDCNNPELVAAITHAAPSSVDQPQRDRSGSLRYEYPVHRAIRCNAYALVRQLIQHDANVRIHDNYNRSFVQYALDHERPEIAYLLVSIAPLDRMDHFGTYAIHTAVHKAYTNVVKRILSYDDQYAHVTTQFDQNTPMHLVRDTDTTTTLYEHGASYTRYNQWRQTPLVCTVQRYAHQQNAQDGNITSYDGAICKLLDVGALAYMASDAAQIDAMYHTHVPFTLHQSQQNTFHMLKQAAYLHPEYTPHSIPSDISRARLPYYHELVFPHTREPNHTQHTGIGAYKTVALLNHGLYLYESPSFMLSRFHNHAEAIPHLIHMAYTHGYMQLVHALCRARDQHEVEKLQKTSYLYDIDICLSKQN